jgi:hypothetical protein
MPHAFPGYRPLPLGQANGGRDGVQLGVGGDTVVFQVKWSSAGREKDPATWLDQRDAGSRSKADRSAVGRLGVA